MSSWKDRICFFDFEVFAQDWLVCFETYATGEKFHIHNDPEMFQSFIENNDFIYCGYNCKHYDNYIMKGILAGLEPYQVKELNDYIIGGNDGWTWDFGTYIKLPPTTDLMLDLPKRQSLKEIEGNLGTSIVESSVPWDIKGFLTTSQFNDTLYYCQYDVASLRALFEKRIDYLESKIGVGERAGLTLEQSLYMTNAQLTAKALRAEKRTYDDEQLYEFPKELNKSLIPSEILHFFETFYVKPTDNVNEDSKNPKLEIDIQGVPHILGIGGLHGARNFYQEHSNEERIILNSDVSSYYPTIMIEYDCISRGVPDRQIFVDTFHARLKAKAEGNKKVADALKLILNTTYGASLNQYSELFDLKAGRSVCINGQLFLIMLIEMLAREVKSFILIQSNTDGIMYSVDRNELEKAKGVVAEWERLTRFGMETDEISRIIQSNVNNYIMVDAKNKLKVKGGWVSDYPNGSFDHNSLSIVAEAIVNHYVYDKPVEKTILACKDPIRFQNIAKCGRSYDYVIHEVDGQEVVVNRTNRIYATRDTRYGKVKKVKKIELFDDEQGKYYLGGKGQKIRKKGVDGDHFIKKDSIQMCPDHAIIDNNFEISIDTIDITWYIDVAKERVASFMNITNPKEEKKVAKPKKSEAEVIAETEVEVAKREDENFIDPCITYRQEKVRFLKKMHSMTQYIREQRMIKDGYNSNQKYEYVKGEQYRDVLGRACHQFGMDFHISSLTAEIIELPKSSSMHNVKITCQIYLTDIETGFERDYQVEALGADNLDKGIAKAETMMIKSFVKNQFLLPPQGDEDDAEADNKPVTASKPASTTYTTPTVEQRADTVTNVVSERASIQYTNQAIVMLTKIQEVEPKFGAKSMLKLQEVDSDGNPTVSKVEVTNILMACEKKADTLGIEL